MKSLRRFLLAGVVVLCAVAIQQPAHAVTTWPVVSNYQVENALRFLKLPVGKVDGVFNESTRRAFCVWRELTGQAINRNLLSLSQRASLVKIHTLRLPANQREGLNLNLTCQSMTWVVRDPQSRSLSLKAVYAASSGMSGYTTPSGTLRIFSHVNAWQESSLYPGAMMYRPQYFNGGRAIHGSATDALVKTYPASHGCVRMLHSAVDALWAGGIGIGTQVQVYGQWRG
jgi:hypothetical protein